MKPAIGSVGTLKELQVEPGDVVEWQNRSVPEIQKVNSVEVIDAGALCGDVRAGLSEYGFGVFGKSEKFRLISRATPEPKMWKDMTPEEKGALLLAAHEGKVIESRNCFPSTAWMKSATPRWLDSLAYRIKPEPARETVTLYGAGKKWRHVPVDGHTHRITFDTIDGEPDCASVKMEKIK